MSNPGDISGRDSPEFHPFRMTRQERESLDPNFRHPKKKVRAFNETCFDHRSIFFSNDSFLCIRVGRSNSGRSGGRVLLSRGTLNRTNTLLNESPLATRSHAYNENLQFKHNQLIWMHFKSSKQFAEGHPIDQRFSTFLSWRHTLRPYFRHT